jgi:hypothetical protein
VVEKKARFGGPFLFATIDNSAAFGPKATLDPMAERLLWSAAVCGVMYRIYRTG